LFYWADICDKQSQDQIAMGLTHNYLHAMEPQSLTEVTQTMKTRVEKQGPGSWVVFVNGQRHDVLFRTRAAARREAKRQAEANKIDNKS
jgi:sarcosine oxidase gamma subunit